MWSPRLLLYRPISSRKLGLMLFSLFLLFLFFKTWKKGEEEVKRHGGDVCWKVQGSWRAGHRLVIAVLRAAQHEFPIYLCCNSCALAYLSEFWWSSKKLELMPPRRLVCLFSSLHVHLSLSILYFYIFLKGDGRPAADRWTAWGGTS